MNYKVSLELLVLHIHALTVWSFLITDLSEIVGGGGGGDFQLRNENKNNDPSKVRD